MSRSAPTTNLLPPRTELVGRSDELAELQRLASDARLVTVLGVGGTGKTRLAREAAHLLVPQFTGGVWFVDLSLFSEAEHAYAELAELLDIPLPAGIAPDRAVVEALRKRTRTLVILDNIEHLAEALVGFVGALLDEAPACSLLVTSREPLRISGEQRLKLAPLSVTDAVQLFAQRALAVDPEFRIDDTNRAAITELVDRVDCLPLGVELAASRANVMTPQKLADRLTHRMSALKTKDRDRPTRHATLRAALEWSWERLDDDSQRALIQAGAFRGGFSLEDAEAVLDEEIAHDEVLQELIEQSLLEYEDLPAGRRYRLFAMVRGFVHERLTESAQHSAVLSRHADYFATRLEDTPSSRLFERREDLPNLRAALERPLDPDLRRRVLIGTGRLLSMSGRTATLAGQLQAALEDASDHQRGELLLLLADAHGLSDSAEAQSYARQALQIGESLGRDDIRARAHLALGVEALEPTASGIAADIDDAIEHLRKAADLTTPPSHETAKAWAYIGRAHARRAEHDLAETAYEEAVSNARAARDEVLLGRVLSDIAEHLFDGRRDADCETALRESREIHARVFDDRFLAHSGATLGLLLAARGETDEARSVLDEALGVAERAGFLAGQTDILLARGLMRSNPGDRTYLVRAIQAHETGDSALEARARSALVVNDLLDLRHDLARHQIRRALGLLADAPRWEGLLCGYMGLSCALTGDAAGATEALDALGAAWSGEGEGFETLGTLFRDASRALSEQDRALSADVKSRATALSEATRRSDLSPHGWRSHDPLATVIELLDGVFGPTVEGPRLQLARDGRRFIPPGGDEVDFSRRGALRLILVALGQSHDERPGSGLSPDDILEAGWPGEFVSAEAGAARVYSAIRTLRSNGLEDVLITRDDGYLLDPDITVDWLD